MIEGVRENETKTERETRETGIKEGRKELMGEKEKEDTERRKRRTDVGDKERSR